MNAMNSRAVAADLAPARDSYHGRFGPLVRTGLIATLVAAAATGVIGGIATAAGVDFAITDRGDTIPVSGIVIAAGVFSLVGVVIAAGLLRWSAFPAKRFVTTAVSLTAISLIPPFLTQGTAGTVGSLLLLHLVAAAVMIPALARKLQH